MRIARGVLARKRLQRLGEIPDDIGRCPNCLLPRSRMLTRLLSVVRSGNASTRLPTRDEFFHTFDLRLEDDDDTVNREGPRRLGERAVASVQRHSVPVADLDFKDKIPLVLFQVNGNPNGSFFAIRPRQERSHSRRRLVNPYGSSLHRFQIKKRLPNIGSGRRWRKFPHRSGRVPRPEDRETNEERRG